MKRRFNKKNFISYCILAGMLFFFMLSSAIPVHAEETDASSENPPASSEEAGTNETGNDDETSDGNDEDSNADADLKEVDAQTAGEEIVHTEKETAAQESDPSDNGDEDAKSADKPAEPDDGKDTDSKDEKDELKDDSAKSEAEIIVEESKPETPDGEEKEVAKLPMVDAPKIEPEPGDNNVFGVAGQYYVSVPKSMAFRKLANGDFETLQSSYYTVNSGLERGYKLSVRVSGVNDDDTVQLANEAETVHRKVEVSTMACDIWQYRPDGTVLTVNEADESGYGKELVLDGPGKFKAKCRLQKWEDDVLNAGTWSGSILFTVTCTPEPEVKDESTDDTAGDEEPQEPETAAPARQQVTEPQPQEAEPQADVAEETEEQAPDAQEEAAEGAEPSEVVDGTEFE